MKLSRHQFFIHFRDLPTADCAWFAAGAAVACQSYYGAFKPERDDTDCRNLGVAIANGRRMARDEPRIRYQGQDQYGLLLKGME